MVENLLSIKTNELNNIVDGNKRLSKNVSFNTDEDDSAYIGDSQHISDAESPATKSDVPLSPADKFKRGIFAIHSPSIDSLNDSESLPADAPLSEKLKKKKQRRLTQQSSIDSGRKVVVRSPPWYTRIDLLKPVSYVVLVIILYLMWTQRAVWIPRLLTSNHRIRHIAIANEQKLQEKGFTPPTPVSDNSNSTASGQDDDDDDDNDDNDDGNNNNKDQTTVSTNEEPTAPTPTKYVSPQKLNIRVRRNKMSFSKERTDKKRRHIQHSVVDDDEDVVDDSGNVDTDSDEVVNDEAVPELPSQIHSSKHHHHQPESKVNRPREKKRKIVPNTKTSLATISQDDIVDQLQKLINARDGNRDLLSVLAKETGLKKEKLKQFIQKKNFRVVSLNDIISIVNSYDSSLLIIPN